MRHSCFTHLDVITPLTFALGGRFRADQDPRNSFMSNTQDLRRARFSEACAERDAISDQVKPLRSARCYHRKAQVHASKADPVTAQIKELEKPLFDLHNEIAAIIGAGLMVMITLRGNVANMKAEVSGIQLEIKKIGDHSGRSKSTHPASQGRPPRAVPRSRVHPDPQHDGDRPGISVILPQVDALESLSHVIIFESITVLEEWQVSACLIRATVSR